MAPMLPSKKSNSRGDLGSKLLVSVRQMNARSFARVTQVEINPVAQVCELKARCASRRILKRGCRRWPKVTNNFAS